MSNAEMLQSVSSTKKTPAPKTSLKSKRVLPPPSYFDPWAEWKAFEKGSPHHIQEKHSPTQTVQLRLTAERSTTSGQRRILDARLWDSLSSSQQDAVHCINLAYQLLNKGLGFHISDWQRIPGCASLPYSSSPQDYMINTYIDWTKLCHKHHVSHSTVIDVLAFGFTCQQVDRERRTRKGNTRKNLFDGLNLYCQLRGWPL